MNAATRSAVSTLLAADPSVSSERIPIGLAFFAGRDPLPSGQPAQQEYLTVAEACDFVRSSRTSLFRAEKDQGLKSVYFRGRKLYRRTDLESALRGATA